MLVFEFALIKIVLHQEVLLELVKFTSDLQVHLEDLQNIVDTSNAPDFKRRLSSLSETIVVHSSLSVKQQPSSKYYLMLLPPPPILHRRITLSPYRLGLSCSASS